MSRQETIAFLEEMQTSAEQCRKVLKVCIADLDGVDQVEEVAGIARQAGQKCLALLGEQQQSWQHFLKIDKGKQGADSATGPQQEAKLSIANDSLQDKIARVAAMGGTPALGGMVLPKLQQKQLTSLSSTESPAARELQIAQGKAEPPSLTSPQPSLETPSNSPPWLVELRKRQGNSRPSSPPHQEQ